MPSSLISEPQYTPDRMVGYASRERVRHLAEPQPSAHFSGYRVS
jgi:hypothetical protein